MPPLSGQTIIFLPGIDGTGISFDPFRAVLPDDVHVNIIRYPTDRLLSFEEMVCSAKRQIQSHQKGAIILAESFSGLVAIALVGSRQIEANCLILCSTFARSPRPVLLKVFGYLPLEPLIKLPLPVFIFKLMIGCDEETAKLFLAMWQKVKTLVPEKVLIHRLKLISQVDVRDWLPKVLIPSLYIQATADRSVPASSLFDFVESVPDLRVRRISGPHFILQAQPRASLDAIEDFLELITRQWHQCRKGTKLEKL